MGCGCSATGMARECCSTTTRDACKTTSCAPSWNLWRWQDRTVGEFGVSMNPVVSSDSTSTKFKSVGRALIVTTDTALAALVQEALKSVAIDSERCDGTVTCFGRVRNARFEAAFIDYHLAAPTIEAIRSSPSNR